MEYDVIIVGAGVVGAFAARELSKYRLKVCLVEKEADAAMGTSKANSSIVHAGYDAEPGTLKAKLNVRGNEIMEGICKELDVPFKRIGSFVLGFEEKDRERLEELKQRGIKNGVKGLQILTRKEIGEKEPNVSPDALYALYAPSAGVVCPYELTIAAVENAVDNGVELQLENKVNNINIENGKFIVSTEKGELNSKFLVNAAGLYADKIAEMLGKHDFSISPRRGEYILFDKNQGKLVNKVLFQLPTDKGKGILVTTTVDGNLLIGPNAEDIDDREDVSTSARGLDEIVLGARKSVPGFNLRETITSFAGLRARPSTGDFIIEASQVNPHLVNAAGIESPGLSAAPAIGEYIVDILRSQGLALVDKKDFNPLRKPVLKFREMDEKELQKVISENPHYGRIVCRCEKVTEGEIIDAIRRSAGARNLDGVKRRTRAGMGRCQGGFCTPRVVEILSRELGIPMEAVTKSGRESKILVGKTK